MEHVLAYVLIAIVIVLVGQFNAKNAVERLRNLLLAMLALVFCFVFVETPVGERVVRFFTGQ